MGITDNAAVLQYSCFFFLPYSSRFFFLSSVDLRERGGGVGREFSCLLYCGSTLSTSQPTLRFFIFLFFLFLNNKKILAIG